ncbi:MAG: hypothetical protein R6T89_00575 [Candidatus Syntrophosphaera sp.]
MYEISVRRPSDEGFQSAPPLWIDPGFLLAVEELQQIDAYQLLCHKGEELVAVLPLYEKKNLGIRRLIIPMSAYYQGLWFFWPSGRKENRILLDELKISENIATFLRKRYRRIHLNLGVQNYDIRGFNWAGFKARPLYTFIQDLSHPFTPLKDERKKIRGAAKQELRLEKAFYPDKFITMLRELYHRKNKNLGVSWGRFRNWMETLHDQELLNQYNLMHDEEIISSNLMLGAPTDDTTYSIMRCTTDLGLKQGASTLHSRLLVENLKDRYQFIDFCGANYPEVARFKAALGFSLRVFFQIEA